MDQTTFETLAERALAAFADAIEAALDDADVEHGGGILTVTLADRRQFVVNRHATNRQIWLSSPISGAHHYDPAEGRWRDSRGGADLAEQLAADLRAATGVAVTLG
ncbi:MAG: iron donor protein CyaY [Alphaproteobacteria bacterium]|nr:iron donor protein CyaY [Alphaproteobacteria bacterium]